MRTLIVSFLPVAIAFGFDISPVQPSIGPGGVVNAASYISQGFANYGIARGSLFLVFGNHLGPDTLVQAGSYPLPSSAGLAGTRVLIDAPGYTAEAFMLYTSTLQVAAIMPSNAPEGDATLTVNYGNRISNPVGDVLGRGIERGGRSPASCERCSAEQHSDEKLAQSYELATRRKDLISE